MTLVMEFKYPGAADVLQPVSRDIVALKPGEIRLRQTVVGVNYIDIYHRSGAYPLPLPAVPGVEALGVVEEVADDVADFQVGDRVVYAGLPAGSYAASRIIPASIAVKPPAELDDEILGGSFLRGLTAYMLLETVGHVLPGQVVLVHAAAGGLGLILTQWGKKKGAKVIGTVGSQAKADLATQHGLDHAILYKQSDFVDVTLGLTKGRGVDLVIDGVGGDTLAGSLRAVRVFGLVASIGQTAGALPLIDPMSLVNRSLIRASIVSLLADRDAYRRAAEAWFEMLKAGFSLPEGARYSLAQAAQAHADLEEGRTSGSFRLIV
ncbi:zinc-binding dehydrogenase [Agrobacterium vitis]|uniref:quinone oxidoreductase family protein n=1 Tax=Agrobacterium vitis TaxID=373 RepID=UPI0012E83936|nr:quinone oxidoreductase [Agrobacterium vitis]MVA17915.1 zinc-binding dehydrogenase [Agrobacterium vitis]